MRSSDEKEWKCSKFLCIVQQQSKILQTRTESLKPYIVSGVWWSVNWFYQLKCTNRTFTCIHGRYYIKLFRTGADSHNDILMSLLLVTEAKNWFMLKLVSAIFYHIYISHQMIALKKFEKCFFISSKKLFSFSRYSIFVFLFFPFFSLSAIALKVDQR